MFPGSRKPSLTALMALLAPCAIATPVYAAISPLFPASADYNVAPQPVKPPETAAKAEQFEFEGLQSNVTQAFDMPAEFYLNKDMLGQVNVSVTQDGAVQMKDDKWLQLLKPHLAPELWNRVSALAAAKPSPGLKEVQATGLKINYDSALMQMHVDIAPTETHLRQIKLRDDYTPQDFDAERAADMSAYITLNGAMDYVSENDIGRTGREPARVAALSAVRSNALGGVVLENNGRYEEDEKNAFQRTESRLIHDDVDNAVRYTAGDLNYSVNNFQAFNRAAGVSVGRVFSIQPYTVTQPLGQTSFLLERPSTVEVLVNGRSLVTVRLQPGPYNITDFPYLSGFNDAELIITDDTGRVERRRFSAFFDSQLLKAGMSEFNYAMGIASSVKDGLVKYDEGEPVASFFHRYGVSDSFTVGADAQGSQHQQLFGTSALWASPVGIIETNFGFSTIDHVGEDFATDINYQYSFTREGDDNERVLNLSANYLGDNFGALGDLNPDNAFSWTFDARYTQDLPWELRGSIGGSYALGRGTQQNEYSMGVFLSRMFGQRWFSSLNVDWREAAQRSGLEATVTFSYRFHDSPSSLTMRHDTQTENSRLDYNYIGRELVDSWSGGASVMRVEDEYTLAGNARYLGNRFESSVEHNIVRNLDGDAQQQRSTARLGTSLVYADGHVALSQPITDSFALLYPHASLKGKKIEVDPVEGTTVAESDIFGPPVVPALRSYINRRVEYNVDDLPLGYDLGASNYSLLPPYKSGTVLEVGSGSSISAFGVLQTPDGQPLPLVYGKAIHQGDPKFAPVEIFSNRVGRFAVQGLKAGTYKLVFQTEPPLTTQITIEDSAIGLINLGTLKAQPELQP